MKKVSMFVLVIVLLYVCLSLPSYIQYKDTSLMERQRTVWDWNYIGVSFNYVLVFLLVPLSNISYKKLGLQAGKWKEKVISYSIVTASILILSRMIDFITKGQLQFYIPSLNVFVFQLIFVAVGEELFWRGYIQGKFGFWYSSIGFGCIHFLSVYFNNGSTLLDAFAYGFITFLLGMIFSWIRKKTESLYPSMLTHGLYNLFNYVIK